MTQEQLDLARLGMTIAQMQLRCMVATANALGQSSLASRFDIEGAEMKKICDLIASGAIRGIDAGAA